MDDLKPLKKQKFNNLRPGNLLDNQMDSIYDEILKNSDKKNNFGQAFASQFSFWKDYLNKTMECTNCKSIILYITSLVVELFLKTLLIYTFDIKSYRNKVTVNVNGEMKNLSLRDIGHNIDLLLRIFKENANLLQVNQNVLRNLKGNIFTLLKTESLLNDYTPLRYNSDKNDNLIYDDYENIIDDEEKAIVKEVLELCILNY